MTGEFMKKVFLVIFCISTFLLTANSVLDLNATTKKTNVISNYETSMEINFTIDKLSAINVHTERGMFSEIAIEGFTHTKNIGEPKLPMLRKIISVPLNADVSVNVTNQKETLYTLNEKGINFPIMPAQASVSKSAQPSDINFVYNSAAYNRNEFENNQLISVEELGILRGMRLFAVNFKPVQYNPASHTIKIFNDVDVTLNFVGGDTYATNRLRDKTFSPYFESVYSQSVLNYREVNSRDQLTRYPVKFVIIADDMFENQLQPFIEWKVEKGFEVIETYTDDIGSSTAQIKNYIQSLWDDAAPEDPAPTFILFVGDTAQIPAYNGSQGSHVTDLNYVKLEGNDYMPEIYYSRFSARNTDELQPQIDKTLLYEKYEMSDPSYLEEVVMIAGMDGNFGATHGNGQINYGTSNYFNAAHDITSHTYLYPQSGNNSANIVQNVSDGVGYVNYTAHGWDQGWADPEFTMTNIDNLQNFEKYPLAVGNCCLTNKFEVGECFGEAWLRAEDKGAIGYIGGTNSTYWDEDYWWGVGNGTPTVNPTYGSTGLGVYDGLFHDHNEPFADWYTTSAGMIFRGNLAVVEGGGADNLYWEIYSLMGDPSLMPYLGIPTVNTASYPQEIFIGLDQMQITAEPYSFVSLSMNGVSHGVELVDASGTLNLNILPFTTTGDARLVITAQNKQPIIADIAVIPNSGPYVTISEVVINAGDDNVIEPDETVIISITLENIGTESATGISMNITEDNQYVSINDAAEDFGDINAGNSVTVNNAFTFFTSSSIPNEHLITLFTDITATEGSWQNTINLTAFAPIIECASAVVSDGQNNTLDPGETADVLLNLENTGGTNASNITVIISTTDTFVSINADSDSIVQIGEGANAAATFNVTANPATPAGHSAVFAVNITADNGYISTDSFSLTVGLSLEDFESGDFTSYPWDFNGNADWDIAGSAHEGSYCAQSGNIGDEQESGLEIELNVTAAGEISFWKKVSSEASYDYLRFYIDGQQQNEWAGNVDWSEESYNVSAGNHTFKWIFEKDYSVSEGSDCAWVDYIIFPGIAASNPVLYVNPGTIDYTIGLDIIESMNLELMNIGAGTISYNINADTDDQWINLDIQSGTINAGETDDIEVTFDSNLLEPGEYNCNIIVTDNLRNETEIPVTLTVNTTDADDDLLPRVTKLEGNYPNPFNPTTSIKYGLKTDADVVINIFNIKGQKVKTLVNEHQTAGYKTALWTGTDSNNQAVSGGIYFYKFSADGKHSSTKKMLLLK
jgi:hypothetical protein